MDESYSAHCLCIRVVGVSERISVMTVDYSRLCAGATSDNSQTLRKNENSRKASFCEIAHRSPLIASSSSFDAQLNRFAPQNGSCEEKSCRGKQPRCQRNEERTKGSQVKEDKDKDKATWSSAEKQSRWSKSEEGEADIGGVFTAAPCQVHFDLWRRGAGW